MGKHAYLIASNNNFSVLEACIDLLDDKRNDLYLLFDKKSNVSTTYKNSIIRRVNCSKVTALNDIVINWGTQIQAVMTLIETANYSGEMYSYIHFFQGADMPIKTQDEIHVFFEGNPQKNYVSIERQRSCMSQNILISNKNGLYPVTLSNAYNCILSKVVDCIAKTIDHLFQSWEYLIMESFGSQFTPDLLNRVHFRSVRRNMQNRYIIRNLQLAGFMPCSSVTNENNHIFGIS